MLEIAASREQLRLHAPPGDLRVEVVGQRRSRHELVSVAWLRRAAPADRAHRRAAAPPCRGGPRRPCAGARRWRREERARPRRGGPARSSISAASGLPVRRIDLEAQLLRERQRCRDQLARDVEIASHRLEQGSSPHDRHLEPVVALDLPAHLLRALQAGCDRDRSVHRRRSARSGGSRSPAGGLPQRMRARLLARDPRSQPPPRPPTSGAVRRGRLRARARPRRRTPERRRRHLRVRSSRFRASTPLVNRRRWVSATAPSAATQRSPAARASLHGLRENLVRARPLPGLEQCPPEGRQEAQPAGIARGQKGDGAVEETVRRPHIASGSRLRSRSRQTLGGTPRKAPAPPRPQGRARLGSDTPARGGSRRPRPARRDRRHVRRSSRRSARAGPPESLSGAPRRPHRGSAGGGSGRRPRPGTAARSGRSSSLRTSAVSGAIELGSVRRERLHRTAVKDAPLDGAAPEHIPLDGIELIEPRGQQRLDRRGHGDVAIRRVAHERDHLLDEERIALPPRPGSSCASPHPPACREQGRDERVGVTGRRAARAAPSSRSACHRPSSAAGRAARAAPCRAGESARCGSGRRRDRRDRGTPLRPSGCRPARRRAARSQRTRPSSIRMAQAISSTEATTPPSPSTA